MDWQRLAALVSERRTDLQMTQEDVRAAGGPSTATMRLIEGGGENRFQPAILARLETALRWQRGSVRQILAGGDPVPFPDEPVTGPLPAVALAPSPEPGYGRDDAGSVPSAVTRNVVLAAINPHERALWKEIHSYPEGTRADEIFSDPLEAALFAREYDENGTEVTELQKIREILAVRSVRVRPPRREARRAG